MQGAGSGGAGGHLPVKGGRTGARGHSHAGGAQTAYPSCPIIPPAPMRPPAGDRNGADHRSDRDERQARLLPSHPLSPLWRAPSAPSALHGEPATLSNRQPQLLVAESLAQYALLGHQVVDLLLQHPSEPHRKPRCQELRRRRQRQHRSARLPALLQPSWIQIAFFQPSLGTGRGHAQIRCKADPPAGI
jgi:hypothetical protein